MAALTPGPGTNTSKRRAKGSSGLADQFAKMFNEGPLKESIDILHADFATDAEVKPVSVTVPPIESVKILEPSPSALKSTAALPSPGPQSPATGEIKQSTEQSSKQSNNQTDNEAMTPAISQANNQTIKQTDNEANNRANKQATEQAIKQTIQQFTEQTDKQSNSQTTEQSPKQPIKQSAEQPDQQSIKHSLEQSPKQTGKQTLKNIYLPLNENQGRILLFLYEHGQGLTNMEIVCAETAIAYGTARTAIDVLIKEGYVMNKERHNGHSFKGFEYSLNNHLCSLYATRVRGEQSAEQSTWQSIQHSSKQSNKQTVEQTINRTVTPFSSRSLLDEKPTTAEDLLRDPELGYWKEKGVTNRQIEKWAEEFSMEMEMILQSLKHCRFEMVVLNHEEEKPIANPMNWFYKVLQRAGFYARPADYKSMAELRAEQMELAAREMIEVRERQATAEAELAFQKILADPTGNDYQALLGQVDSFAKDMGGKALETALREAFLKERG
jgi:hypothetical protein